MTLRHATKPTTDHSRCHRHRSPHLYTVARCPGDEFPRDAQFNRGDVYSGLADGTWSTGTVFVSPTGQRMVVQGRRLVEEGATV